jgi:hypothetical protein
MTFRKYLIALALSLVVGTASQADQTKAALEQRAQLEDAERLLGLREKNWVGVPVEQYAPIVRYCYVKAGGNEDGSAVPDYQAEADCIQHQVNGWGALWQVLPPVLNAQPNGGTK